MSVWVHDSASTCTLDPVGLFLCIQICHLALWPIFVAHFKIVLSVIFYELRSIRHGVKKRVKRKEEAEKLFHFIFTKIIVRKRRMINLKPL